jgi:hypothetical protein
MTPVGGASCSRLKRILKKLGKGRVVKTRYDPIQGKKNSSPRHHQEPRSAETETGKTERKALYRFVFRGSYKYFQEL